MTTGLKNACKKKNLLYKLFLKNRTIERETKYKNKLTAILRYSAKQHYSNILELNKMNMKESWIILNTVINQKEKGSQYPTQFNDDARKVTGNIDIANGFNRFFSNIGPALARNIPNGNTNFTNYLNQKVEDSKFLNPITDEEIFEIVKDAKTKYSKDHDSIDMSLVKLVIPGNIDIANGFNRFFSNIGPALARNIPNGNTNFTNYLNQKVEDSIFLNPITDEEIIEIVKDAKTKYSKDHDSIDMSLVKLVIPYIVKPLKHIFNISLQKGVFPDRMKIARVIPIFKTGDVQEFSNYRPISILPQFSKILDKIFHSRLA